MQRLRWGLLGMMCAVIVALLSAGLFIWTSKGMSARAEPSAFETWIARRVRKLSVPRSAMDRTNPVVKTPDVLAAGLAHWADHCAVCHANNGSGETAMGKGMYPPAPDMRQSPTQEMTDGELFYVIENGVRLTGMPGWGNPGHGAADSWKLVHFIRHLPELSFAEIQEMRKLNPKGPDQIEEEKAAEEFLRGDNENEKTEHRHTH